MKTKSGFTLIETVVLIAAFALISGFLAVEKTNIDAMSSDARSKSAINAMYYALEESFYKTHEYYPESISANTLPTVSPDLWDIAYTYEPASCFQGHCSAYKLSVELKKEAEYLKESAK